MAEEELFSKEMAEKLKADERTEGSPASPGRNCQACGEPSRAASRCYIRAASQSTFFGGVLTIRWVTFATAMCSRCYYRGAYIGLMPFLRWTAFFFVLPMASFLVNFALKQAPLPNWLPLAGIIAVPAMALGFYVSRCRRYIIQRRRLPEILGHLDWKLRDRLGSESWNNLYVVSVTARIARKESASEL